MSKYHPTLWTGTVTREYAEYVMGAVSLAGGFVAVGLPLDDGRLLAAIPDGMSIPSGGRHMTLADFRALLVRRNSCEYLGRGEDLADERGFATDEAIRNLLDVIDPPVGRPE